MARKDKIKKEKKIFNPLKKYIDMWIELNNFGYSFTTLKQIEIYLFTILITLTIGILFKLKIFFIIPLLIFVFMLLPGLITSYYKNKYEEKRIVDAKTYIEQMLYSFRRSHKILNSLEDTLSVFSDGNMKDAIIKAIEIIKSENLGENRSIYEKALNSIEEKFPAKRINSLHRYLMKVENIGGRSDKGIDALLKDRSLWIDRISIFRKETNSVIFEIIFSCIFSLIMSCIMVRILPSDLVDLSNNILYQIMTTIFIMLLFFTTYITFKTTIIKLNENRESKNINKALNDLEYVRNFDKKEENKKSRIKALVFIICSVIGLFIKNKILIISGIILFIFFMFFYTSLKLHLIKKRVSREVEKVYPDWLLEMALLLQSENLHNAIEKTVDTAPILIRKDLKKLSNDIILNPTSLLPYVSFLDFLPLETIHSSMKLLYSIYEFGSIDDSIQISELVERNNNLMDKAEKYMNDDKLSIVFSMKFVPMLSSSIKLLIDIVLFLFSYLQIMSQIV